MFEPLTGTPRNGRTIMKFWHCKLTTSFSHGQIFPAKDMANKDLIDIDGAL